MAMAAGQRNSVGGSSSGGRSPDPVHSVRVMHRALVRTANDATEIAQVDSIFTVVAGAGDELCLLMSSRYVIPVAVKDSGRAFRVFPANTPLL